MTSSAQFSPASSALLMDPRPSFVSPEHQERLEEEEGRMRRRLQDAALAAAAAALAAAKAAEAARSNRKQAGVAWPIGVVCAGSVGKPTG